MIKEKIVFVCCVTTKRIQAVKILWFTKCNMTKEFINCALLAKCATARSRCLGILVYCLNAMPHLYAVRCSSHGACSCGGRRRGANQRCSPCTVTQRRGAKARDSNASSAEARNGRTESRLVKCSSVMILTLRPLRSVVDSALYN